MNRKPELRMTRPLARPLAIALLVGTIVLGVAAVVHPVLRGDAASHLRIIADSGHWRAVHLTMLGCTALVMAGLWVRLVVHTGPPGALIAALAIITTGMAVHSLNVAYMTGSGWELAVRFAAGEDGMAALYDVTHPIGLMASRYGNFIVALGAGVLAWAEHDDPATPPYLTWVAAAAAVLGLGGAALFHESTKGIFAAVAVLSLWQVATAWRAWSGSSVGS
jgi:hypothetical protein